MTIHILDLLLLQTHGPSNFERIVAHVILSSQPNINTTWKRRVVGRGTTTMEIIRGVTSSIRRGRIVKTTMVATDEEEVSIL